METQFFFDQMISLCHILMRYENVHFNLEHSSPTKCSHLFIYFNYDDDETIKAVSDFILAYCPFFYTSLIVFQDKDPFKVLKVQVK